MPTALLWPEREVALVPSATAWEALGDQDPVGANAVLALGDPDYGGRKLRRLPASRREAETIGETC